LVGSAFAGMLDFGIALLQQSAASGGLGRGAVFGS